MDVSHWREAARSFLKPGEQRRRLLMALCGVVICALSVGFFRQAAFGTDPFQCMCNGIDNVVPLDFGTLYVIICLILLAAMLLIDRHYMGVATFINLFLTGYIVEFSEWAIHSLFGDPTMAMRVVYLAIGIVVMCLASALYFTADLGVSTYDFIALHLAKVQKRVPFRLIRIGTDLVCVAIGFALGFVPGVGTIITAFFMGPLISLFNERVAQPLRYGGKRA
ncbi:MAG: hypothetical protein IJ048_14235 [Clostridia bacterium]|nr:hypothetical protein [Clostridia bacterium]